MNITTSEEVKPRVPRGRLYLRPDEANKLIRQTAIQGRNPLRDKVLVRLTYRHGLRASEACRMRWSQFDLDRGTVLIARAKGGVDGTHCLDRDELRDLRKLRQQQGDNALYVFESERGGPVSIDTLARIVRDAGKAAGLDVHVHPHMLRHAAGYALINDGTDVRLVQEFLGHRSIQSTAHYTAISPKRLAGVRVR